MHLFLYGESGAGKTYCIDRALSALHITPKGFRTRRETDAEGVLLRGSAGPRRYTLARWVNGRPVAYPERFDALGATLQSAGAGDVLLLDELGRIEADAAGFQASVLAALNRPCRAIGVLRDVDTPFLNAVRETPGMRLLPLTPNTRAETYRLVRDFLRPRSLCEALGVGIGMTALVGGGGKTTLLYALGQELAKEDRVLLTTTTHLGKPETPAAYSMSALHAAQARGENPVCILGVPEGDKCAAPEASMETLLGLCDCLLIEADGAKQMPLKAHASYEPVIPAGAHTICVLGADGFGRPIREVVHRGALFAAALGVGEDEPVTPQMLAQAAHRADTVFINKVETAERLAAARAFARARTGRTVLGSLQSARPVIEIWEGELCVW